jgi:hypothetical protein
MMTARRVLALLWLPVPPLLLSALVHSIDPDVGGVAGLTSRSAVVSVLFYAAPVVGACGMVLALAVARGWRAAVTAAVAASLMVAQALVVAQRREGNWLDEAWSLIGGTAVVLVFVALTVVPAKGLGWPRR